MQFSDQPNFSVAGVSDWTAAGGHGSDSVLRTSESLVTATAKLKSGEASHAASANADAGARENADALRLSGERFEASGDALGAVRAFEQATALDPAEANYFAWGSELLSHRAIWQAQEIFRKGVVAYPRSARMSTALGTALFAGARYEEAAQSLCNASDLEPSETEPYLFMGRMQIAAPDSLSCVAPHLARFLVQQPGSSAANYLYAMALLRRQQNAQNAETTDRVEALLKQTVAIDPQCGEAYLQLGILANAEHNTQQAISYYTRASEATPSLADAHYRLGVLYDRMGEHEKASQEFQRHDEIMRQQATLTDQQRRSVKQFVFAKPDASTPTGAP